MNEGDEHKQHLKRKRLTEEAVHASSVAARELRAVVSLASRRGLNAEEIFRHFVVDEAADAREGEANAGCRRAGKEDVVKGMEGLGIALSEEAAAVLIETIVRSSGEPPGQHFTRPAADAEQLRGNVDQSMRVPKERGYAAIAGAERAKPTRARETSLKRSAAGRKSLPPLPRQHITAEDLWNFASRTSVHGGKSQSSSEDAKTPIDQGEEGTSSAGDESLPPLSQEESKQVATHHSDSIHGEAGASSLQKRARNTGSARGGGSAKEATRKGILCEGAPRGMGSTGPLRPFPASTPSGDGSGSIAANNAHHTNRGYNQQTFGNPRASLLTTSSFSATGNAAAAPTTADSTTCTTPSGLKVAAGEHAPRPHSMPTQLGSIDSCGAGGLEESDGSLLGARRRRTLSARGGSVAVVPAAAPSASHEKAEVASFPCDNPTLEATDGKDRVFHVDRCDRVCGVRLFCHDG